MDKSDFFAGAENSRTGWAYRPSTQYLSSEGPIPAHTPQIVGTGNLMNRSGEDMVREWVAREIAT